MKSTDELIAQAYENYRDRVVSYINYRINDEEAARDLTQEVFLRMLEYSQLIYEEAMENFIFTIARNKVNDYLRHYYVRSEFDRYMHDYAPVSEDSTEQTVTCRDLERIEKKCIESLPTQRARVYMLKRYEEMSAKEISERLGMSVRTVENHYYMGVRQVRQAFAACI
ncbi:MAG: sigma-70 family RNA polymerase sigma factor [Muribaculaceae bacterium]|nr:sigma-70 family RNA polymerase sigma factor [Bacteroides sp.]MDE7472397.1 sigma-70 family RNA polymerase sigma factor [Muribaculaceae bacterium]